MLTMVVSTSLFPMEVLLGKDISRHCRGFNSKSLEGYVILAQNAAPILVREVRT